MKRSMILLSALVLFAVVFAVEAGALNINQDTTWGPSGGPIIITDSIYLSSNAKLTILPGTIIQFAPEVSMWIASGALDAEQATFTWNNGAGEWLGIRISNADARTRLVGCAIEHAKGYNTTWPAMLVFQGTGGSPLVQNCIIGNGSAPQGIQISMDAPSTPQILGNTISGFSDCGVLLTSYTSATVTGNTFSANAYGTCIRYPVSNLTLSSNTYSGSTTGDVRVDAIRDPGITLSTDAVWNEMPGTVYHVLRNLNFSNNSRLTIANGIIVKFAADRYLYMSATSALDADRVMFTKIDGGDEWLGIRFNDADARTRLVGCTIEHAKGYSTSWPAMLVFLGTGGSPLVQNCIIGNGSAPQGIHIEHGRTVHPPNPQQHHLRLQRLRRAFVHRRRRKRVRQHLLHELLRCLHQIRNRRLQSDAHRQYLHRQHHRRCPR